VATGRLFCSMPEFHAEAERLLGRPILTHELVDEDLWDGLRRALEAELGVEAVANGVPAG
jgi:hypothetical protein